MATSTLKTDFRGKVSVTADGVKTVSQLLTELKGLVDTSKVDYRSAISINGNIFNAIYPSGLVFGCLANIETNRGDFDICKLNSAKYMHMKIEASGTTFIDNSSFAFANGENITLYY